MGHKGYDETRDSLFPRSIVSEVFEALEFSQSDHGIFILIRHYVDRNLGISSSFRIHKVGGHGLRNNMFN